MAIQCLPFFHRRQAVGAPNLGQEVAARILWVLPKIESKDSKIRLRCGILKLLNSIIVSSRKKTVILSLRHEINAIILLIWLIKKKNVW